ncbi:glycosyltransferase family 25 protein [Acetobacter tropicalis]|nr:glycosyltransferase family 25 protein [Acetobacter tropicalis]
MIDPVHVISLERTPQRYAAFCHFNSHLPHVRVSACEGALLNRDHCCEMGICSPDLDYSSGALGSAVSHMRLWQDAIQSQMVRHIAEDDAIIRPDFHEIYHEAVKAAPEWDIFLWSYNDDWPVGLVSTFGHVASLKGKDISPDFIVRNYRIFQEDRRKPSLLPLSSAAGIGFYSISPQGAKKLIDACFPLQGLHARYAGDTDMRWQNRALDVEMSRHYQTLNAYVSYPPMAVMINDSANSTLCGQGQMSTVNEAS